MNSCYSSSTYNDNEEDNYGSRDSNNHIRIFSPSTLQPQRQPSQPFWNFLSAPLSHDQVLFHASSSTNAHPISYNNGSDLSLNLTHTPWPKRAIGRGGDSSSSSMINSNQQYPVQRPSVTASDPQPAPRRRTDQLMAGGAVAAMAAASSKPYHLQSPSLPCSECGRLFPSSKALFGHMRCHPERMWRGINPPPNARPPAPPAPKAVDYKELNESERDVVEALIFLATGVKHKMERPSDINIPRAADNARFVGTSTEQDPAGQEGGHLEEGEGEVAGERSASSSSSMRYVLDLNLPPPPEDTEGGDGTDM